MKTLLPKMLCAAALAVTMTSFSPAVADAAAASGSGSGAGTANLAKGNEAFACDLYTQLSGREGNLFFSPYSISDCLAMAYAGARGDTATQMAKTLHFTMGDDALHAAFGQLADHLKRIGAPIAMRGGTAKPSLTLKIANNLWPQKGASILPDYLALAQKDYDASITPLDYKGAADAARDTINTWVENQTEKKIKDLIPPGTLNAATRLVLVNAVYFYGNWLRPFDPKLTKDEPFTVAAGKTVQAPLMTLKSQRYSYAENDDMQLLQMNYLGGGLSMLVLLPKAPDGLPKLESSLSAANIDAWRKLLKNNEVDVTFPKFRLDDSFQLDRNLKTLGMSDAFDGGKADFSGIDGQKDLSISAVVHKSYVDVNERGTEAAAATGAVMTLTMAPGQKATFRADHPFLFMIQENQTGSILFLGRVTDPTAGAK